MDVCLWAEAGAVFPSTCKRFTNKSCCTGGAGLPPEPPSSEMGEQLPAVATEPGNWMGPLRLEDPFHLRILQLFDSVSLLPHLPIFLQSPSLSVSCSKSLSSHSPLSVSPQATRHDTRACRLSGPHSRLLPQMMELNKAPLLHCNTGNSWQQAPRPIWDGATLKHLLCLWLSIGSLLWEGWGRHLSPSVWFGDDHSCLISISQ